MTENPSFKRRVRARMAATGEKYTEARRVLTTSTASAPTELDAMVGHALQPGKVMLTVNASGLINLALVLPTLLRLRDAGHEVVAMPLCPEDPDALFPSPVDVICAAGLASPAAVLKAPRPVFRQLHDRACMRFRFLGGALPEATWQNQLAAVRQRTGRPPVLYVQDIQESGPLLEWELRKTEAEANPLQLAPGHLSALRRLTREVDAITVVGHCVSEASLELWRNVAGAADTVLASEVVSEAELKKIDARRFHVTEYEGDVRVGRVEASIDTSFQAWRRHRN